MAGQMPYYEDVYGRSGESNTDDFQDNYKGDSCEDDSDSSPIGDQNGIRGRWLSLRSSSEGRKVGSRPENATRRVKTQVRGDVHMQKGNNAVVHDPHRSSGRAVQNQQRSFGESKRSLRPNYTAGEALDDMFGGPGDVKSSVENGEEPAIPERRVWPWLDDRERPLGRNRGGPGSIDYDFDMPTRKAGELGANTVSLLPPFSPVGVFHTQPFNTQRRRAVTYSDQGSRFDGPTLESVLHSHPEQRGYPATLPPQANTQYGQSTSVATQQQTRLTLSKIMTVSSQAPVTRGAKRSRDQAENARYEEERLAKRRVTRSMDPKKQKKTPLPARESHAMKTLAAARDNKKKGIARKSTPKQQKKQDAAKSGPKSKVGVSMQTASPRRKPGRPRRQTTNAAATTNTATTESRRGPGRPPKQAKRGRPAKKTAKDYGGVFVVIPENEIDTEQYE